MASVGYSATKTDDINDYVFGKTVTVGGGKISLSNSVWGNQTTLNRTGEVSWLQTSVTNAVPSGTPCWQDPMSNSMASRWDFVQTATNAVDTALSGKSNFMSKVGSPEYVVQGTNMYGMVIYGWQTMRTNYLMSSTLNGLSTTNGAVSFWFRKDTIFSSGTHLPQFTIPSSANVTMFSINGTRISDSSWRLRGWIVTNNVYVWSGNWGVCNTGGWYHIVFSHDGQSLAVYTNGAQSALSSWDNSTATNKWLSCPITDAPTKATTLIVGGRSDLSDTSTGTYCNVRIYTNQLTASQVATLYAYEGGSLGPTNSQEWRIEDAPVSSTNYYNYVDTLWRHQPNGLNAGIDFIGNGSNNLTFDSILETHSYSNTITQYANGTKQWPAVDNFFSLGDSTHGYLGMDGSRMATSNGVTLATNVIWGYTTNLVTGATNTEWIAVTNLVTGTTNIFWGYTTNLTTGATNTQWISITNLLTQATNTEWIAFTNLLTGTTNTQWIAITNLFTLGTQTVFGASKAYTDASTNTANYSWRTNGQNAMVGTAVISNANPTMIWQTTGDTNTGVISRGATNTFAASNKVSVLTAYPTGGSRTNAGAYTIHTFTNNGTFVVNQPLTVEVLVVGGGGGGGTRNTVAGGGGGGGGITNLASTNLIAGSFTVVVGAGGSSANGSNSSFSVVTAFGGGKGGNGETDGSGGGSGGGAGGGTYVIHYGGAGSQGANGGNNYGGGSPHGGGGGGGGPSGVVGGRGGTGPDGGGGNGGSGTSYTTCGTGTTYYAGGGHGGYSAQTGRSLGGGGYGVNGGPNANGLDGYGAGGVGAWSDPATGGTGGCGVVIIKYLTADVVSTIQTPTIWKSQNSNVEGEYGVQTFGDYRGRTVIEGASTRFNVAGVEQLKHESAVLYPFVDNFTDFGKLAYRIKNLYVVGITNDTLIVTNLFNYVRGINKVCTNGIGSASTTTYWYASGVVTQFLIQP